MDQQREQAQAAHPDAGLAVVNGMGWALRRLAHSARWNTPGWEQVGDGEFVRSHGQAAPLLQLVDASLDRAASP